MTHNIASHQSWWKNRPTSNTTSNFLHHSIRLNFFFLHFLFVCCDAFRSLFWRNDVKVSSYAHAEHDERLNIARVLCNQHKNWIKSHLAGIATSMPHNMMTIRCVVFSLSFLLDSNIFFYYHYHCVVFSIYEKKEQPSTLDKHSIQCQHSVNGVAFLIGCWCCCSPVNHF